MSRKNKKQKTPWQPFQRAYYPEFTPEDLATRMNIDIKPAKEQHKRMLESIVFKNNLYEVAINKITTNDVGFEMLHLSIKRLDKNPIHDWRHFQRIKNELVGEECEAVELYPAESRLVDGANQYHLWAIPTTNFRFPFGYQERLVGDIAPNGGKQRPHKE